MPKPLETRREPASACAAIGTAIASAAQSAKRVIVRCIFIGLSSPRLIVKRDASRFILRPYLESYAFRPSRVLPGQRRHQHADVVELIASQHQVDDPCGLRLAARG